MKNRKAPFVYGTLAFDDYFTDRVQESIQLKNNFLNGTNTILISPRRWGKSSLVKKAAKMALKENKNLRICFVDLFNVRSEQEFYENLALQILKNTSSRWEEMMANSKRFLGRLLPIFTVSTEPNSDFSLAMDWKELKKSPEEILNMAERIAEEKKLHIVICIDEFQNISEFGKAQPLQKKLRSHWQTQRHCSYCLYGSKRHMMMNVFTNPSMPFYKFGELMFLDKIGEKDWVTYIIRRFKNTGKKIGRSEAAEIARYCENHPYYVQQLAQQAWLRTEGTADIETVKNAMESLTLQLSLIFQNITDTLSTPQLNLLHAIIRGEDKLTSRETLEKYRIGTSATAIRSREALINKEILDMPQQKAELLDPIYKYWLQHYYFI